MMRRRPYAVVYIFTVYAMKCSLAAYMYSNQPMMVGLANTYGIPNIQCIRAFISERMLLTILTENRFVIILVVRA